MCVCTHSHTYSTHMLIMYYLATVSENNFGNLFSPSTMSSGCLYLKNYLNKQSLGTS